MDIYDYLDSWDIATHCREIGYTFNLLEAASIIAKSHYAIEVKFDGWRTIIRGLEDMSVDTTLYPTHSPEKSLSNRLSRYMHNYRCEIDEWNDEADALYCVGQNCFRHLDEALRYAQKYQSEKKLVRVSKHRPGSLSVNASYNLNGTLIELDGNFDKIWGNDDRHYFQKFNIFVPTPFIAGDILVATPLVSGAFLETSPFVLEKIPVESREQHQAVLRCGNNDNLRCQILCMTENGIFMREAPASYLHFRYFKGELIGKRRALKYIQQFYRGKISVGEMLCAQSQAAFCEAPDSQNELADML